MGKSCNGMELVEDDREDRGRSRSPRGDDSASTRAFAHDRGRHEPAWTFGDGGDKRVGVTMGVTWTARYRPEVQERAEESPLSSLTDLPRSTHTAS
jgi:hypothetical protein